MTTERVGDMTLDELREWVNRQVDRRLQERAKAKDGRTVQEINESIRRHRLKPPPGSPTNLDLIREDRDR